MQYLISTKHTHKNDAFITLWRPDDKGYCWYKDWAGKYDTNEDINSDATSIRGIDCEKIDNLFVKVKYENEIREILSNTKEVRKVLNLTIKDFYRLHQSVCPKSKDLKHYLL